MNEIIEFASQVKVPEDRLALFDRTSPENIGCIEKLLGQSLVQLCLGVALVSLKSRFVCEQKSKSVFGEVF